MEKEENVLRFIQWLRWRINERTHTARILGVFYLYFPKRLAEHACKIFIRILCTTQQSNDDSVAYT